LSLPVLAVAGSSGLHQLSHGTARAAGAGAAPNVR
jgi:hypothetical protein